MHRGAVVLLAAALHALTAAAAFTVRDDAGHDVRLDGPAQRIVTLAPFLTEIAYEVGAGDRVVAVSEHSDWPEAARRLPQVGNAFTFSLERIAALHPDLVLVWKDSMRAADLERLERFGARVFVVEARTLSDVPRALAAVGRLTGGDGLAPARRFEARIEALRARHAHAPRLRVLLEIWHQPLTTLGGRHFMNEALEACGASNAFEDLPGVAPVVGWEDVYRRDPDAIVAVSEGITREAFLDFWGARPTLRAVKTGRLAFVAPDRLQRQSARLADGVADLCAALDRIRPAT
ncbi:MAG TPA: cobalamin-binding protein [Usitatibacter sp.]|jgi:iron complex transport system substrate-binding protein|nr:cobalamin-binding protein [Usitatibacter sp.]